MRYPMETASALSFLGFADADFTAETSDGVTLVLTWQSAAPQPPEQEISDALADLTVVNEQTFSQWRAENGGDATLTARRLAKEGFDATLVSDRMVDRAIVLELLDHLNAQMTKYDDLLTWLGTQTTLLNRSALAGFASSQPSAAQARAAILTRITDGEADT